jgi:hypothetical protein
MLGPSLDAMNRSGSPGNHQNSAWCPSRHVGLGEGEAARALLTVGAGRSTSLRGPCAMWLLRITSTPDAMEARCHSSIGEGGWSLTMMGCWTSGGEGRCELGWGGAGGQRAPFTGSGL